MPLLLALGQHGALEAVQRSLRGDERLLAFLDDIYIITTQPRVGVLVARAMPLSRLPVLRTLEPWCGRDLTCLSRIRALREHHWATLSCHSTFGAARCTICMVDLASLCLSAGELSVAGGATRIGAPFCRES